MLNIRRQLKKQITFPLSVRGCKCSLHLQVNKHQINERVWAGPSGVESNLDGHHKKLHPVRLMERTNYQRGFDRTVEKTNSRPSSRLSWVSPSSKREIKTSSFPRRVPSFFLASNTNEKGMLGVVAVALSFVGLAILLVKFAKADG